MTEYEYQKRARHAEYDRQYRDRCKMAGRCTDCGRPAVPGHTQCAEHLRRRSEYWHRITAARRQHALCIRCGDRAEPGRTMCSWCAAKQREANREQRELAIARGLCVTCRKRPHSPGMRTCEACRAQAKQAREKAKVRRQRRQELHARMAISPEQVLDRLATLLQGRPHKGDERRIG